MKAIKQLLLCLTVISSLSLTSCSSDDDGGGNGNAASGTLTAKIDGVSFTSLQITSFANKVDVNGDFTLTLQGNTADQAISMTIVGYTGEGTYEISDSNVFITAVYTEPNITNPLNSPTWAAPYANSGVIGEINISEESDSGVKGTFNFTGQNSNDNTTKVISEGSFDLDFL